MPPVRDWMDPMGVPVRIYGSRWKGARKDIVFALRVAGMLIRERRNYQLVYFLMQGLHLAAGLPVARFLGKPILMKIGGSGVIPLLTRSPSGRLELRWLRKWARRVMVLNEGMREEALREGFRPERLLWMPNPVDTGEFAPCDSQERLKLRERFGIPAAAPVVLYCGRLAPEKALPSLMAAFALVARRKPEAMLLLVGDGPMRDALARQAAALDIGNNVRFAGRVEPAEVRSWLRIADVFTLVSPSEGFPCALAEAMSAGLPAVVSDIPANRQLVDDGRHGLLTPVGDTEAIAAAILRLAEDAGLRASMGQAARGRILDNYSTEKVAARYETLFRETLA
jgi:glycosyltransferase involved in cell wall biosynthesis